MAISDVLFEAESELAGYLRDPFYRNMYGAETIERCERLLEEMDAIRMLPGLDTPPREAQQPRRTAQEIMALPWTY
jgi:hypothetical protein